MNQDNIQIIQIDSCDSTNTAIWKYYKSDKLTVLISKHQTSGRGRLGRTWQSTNGALNLTIAFSPSFYNIKDFESISWLTLITGMSLRDAVIELIESKKPIFLSELKSKLHLKWPNDLYFENKKLAGILCESKSEGNNLHSIAIGIGMNVHSIPNNLDAISLIEIFARYSEQEFNLNFSSFALSITKHMEKHIKLLLNSDFITLKDLWLKSAHILNHQEFLNPEKTKKIHFLDLSLNGNCIALDNNQIIILN